MQPRLSQLTIWEKHQERVYEILEKALMLLRSQPELIRDENKLNRALYYCMLDANRHFHNLGRGIDSPLIYDANNQPAQEHIQKAPREDKRPDFQWGYIDHNEVDPRKSSKMFCIECKRLGQPISNWKLNENYVNDGIVRFMVESHGYAWDVKSSAMVGYLESLDFDIVLGEINTALTKLGTNSSEIEPLDKIWKIDRCNHLQHQIERSFSLSPFELRHFWIDVRGKLTPPLKKSHITRLKKKKKTSRSPYKTKQGFHEPTNGNIE